MTSITTDLRRTLGQFATGVTIITARADDGRRIGVTANSFTSVSLEPPLVLFCIAKKAPSHADFETAQHFAIHVLAASQHHLSRQFATPAPDKFAGVAVRDDPRGVPLLEDVLARLVCRHHGHYEGGDHTVFLGEVEDFDWFDGEPLIFHGGGYRVATQHPDLAE